VLKKPVSSPEKCIYSTLIKINNFYEHWIDWVCWFAAQKTGIRKVRMNETLNLVFCRHAWECEFYILQQRASLDLESEGALNVLLVSGVLQIKEWESMWHTFGTKGAQFCYFSTFWASIKEDIYLFLSFAIFWILSMLTIDLLDSDPKLYFSTPQIIWVAIKTVPKMQYLAFEDLFSKLCYSNTGCDRKLKLGGLIVKGWAHPLAMLKFWTGCIDFRGTYISVLL
jgi:hypothetical protein